MDERHLEGLRRFALTSAVALLAYVIAGVQPKTEVSAFGVTATITRPELFPIGLVLACIWGGLFRFTYYGMMLGTSPYRRRREILDDLQPYYPSEEEGRQHLLENKSIPMFFGPRDFQTGRLHYDRSFVEARASDIRSAFPKVLR